MKKIVIIGITFLLISCLGLYYWCSNFRYPLRYEQEIKIAAQSYQIQPALIAAIINAESSFNKDKISRKGAVGLMQILPSTARYITATEVDLLDAATNIKVGTQYLAYLIKKFNDTETALFAYNAGEGNVSRWLNEQQVTQLTHCPFRETNAYVNKIKKTLTFYQKRLK